MAKRLLRKTNRTVLIVVEGDTEEAFATHLKSLYYQRGMRLSVSLKNAHGYGPQGVIDKLKSVAQTADFDQRIAVMDADIPLTPATEKWLRKGKVATIISSPAIEATLLAILGKHAPDSTDTCKSELQKHAPGDPSEARYYAKYLPRETLERARGKVPALDALIAAVSTE
jgi:hypothetical protein